MRRRADRGGGRARTARRRRAASGSARAAVPQEGDESLRLLRRVGHVDPTSLDDYRAHGGYAALRRALRDRARGRHPRGQGLEAPGPRRRRVPDRREMGGGRAAAGTPALPDLQRRRVRARHVQGPGDHRGRPVRADRGDDDRGLRDRMRPGVLYLRGEYPRRAPMCSAERSTEARRARVSRRRHPRRGIRVRHRDAQGRAARTSAARRPRSSTRSRAIGASRATSRPSRSSRGCSRSRPSSTTSRRWSTCSTIVLARGPAFAEIGNGGVDRNEALLPLGSRRAAGRLRGAVRGDAAASCSTWRAASPAGARCRRSCWAARRACSSGPTSSISRSRSKASRAAKTTLGSGVVMVLDDTVDLPRFLMRIAAVLPRRVVRSMRPVPRRHRAPGGGARPPLAGRPTAVSSASWR